MDYAILKSAGIDTDALISRLMGNEELIKKFMKKFLLDDNFKKLKKAVRQNNSADALTASHTLKGMCGNLSIMRLFELFSRQVELIRREKWEEAKAMMPQICEEYEHIENAVADWLEHLR